MKIHMVVSNGAAACAVSAVTFCGTDRPDLVTCARCRRKLQAAMRKRQRVDVAKLAGKGR